MYVGIAMRNEKQQKRHRIHMDAVMTEMMAKNNM